ncbi:hypothetical protein LCGC14_1590770 [marine sediment metagenome]|uniref:Uncharacterized protein n=1 Tax=marine sediment metagenome TaxID=412755 RepID=A0A0F9LEH3_9ZZZZ
MANSYLDCWWYWLDCALPLRINLEAKCSGYFEIELQILFFNITFTKVSEKFKQETKLFLKGISNNG